MPPAWGIKGSSIPHSPALESFKYQVNSKERIRVEGRIVVLLFNNWLSQKDSIEQQIFNKYLPPEACNLFIVSIIKWDIIPCLPHLGVHRIK